MTAAFSGIDSFISGSNRELGMMFTKWRLTLFCWLGHNLVLCKPRGKEKLEKLTCERILQGFEFPRAFLPPVSHGLKRGKFQKPVKIAHKAVVSL